MDNYYNPETNRLEPQCEADLLDFLDWIKQEEKEHDITEQVKEYPPEFY
jgi:hypothetical protein